MRFRHALAALGALLAVAAGGEARAQTPETAARSFEFFLTVPLRLTNLRPAVTGGVVACVVGPLGVAAVARPGLHPAERVGFGVAPFSVDPGTRAFWGDVTVAVDAEPGKDVAAATHYKCWLQLGGGGDAAAATGLPRSDAPEAHLVPRADSQSSLVITGEVPR